MNVSFELMSAITTENVDATIGGLVKHKVQNSDVKDDSSSQFVLISENTSKSDLFSARLCGRIIHKCIDMHELEGIYTLLRQTFGIYQRFSGTPDKTYFWLLCGGGKCLLKLNW